jgi:hypothetical protein
MDSYFIASTHRQYPQEEKTMYARNVTVQVEPERLDEVIQLWKERIPPGVKDQAGFVSAYLLADRVGSRLRSVGFWETEADLQRSAAWNQEQLAGVAEYLTAPAAVEAFEVVSTVLPAHQDKKAND